MAKRTLLRLTILAAVLMTAVCVLLVVGKLLAALGDALGAQVVNYAALFAGVLLIVNLVALLFTQTWLLLEDRADDPPDEL